MIGNLLLYYSRYISPDEEEFLLRLENTVSPQ
jgi:hypothetical protein